MFIRPSLNEILQAKSLPKSSVIGTSRGGKDIHGFKFGQGSLRISLIAGCHADEPTGPIFLNHFVRFLGAQPKESVLLSEYSWWIVPHVNPDAEMRNRSWYSDEDTAFSLTKNLEFSQRELPGDDVEFGFPLLPDIPPLRPENQAVYNFWESANAPFDLHVSLHGMRTAYGPWFLIDKDFILESKMLMEECLIEVQALNYQPHDVDRKGEKGFYRIGEGFGSRPDSKAMRDYFLDQNDKEMAEKFHASSMESIRGLGGSCLTLVTEMPLFILPRMNNDLKWPDTTLVSWSKQMQHWKLLLAKNQITPQEMTKEAHAKGLRAMPVLDQMHLQWVFIWAGIKQQFNRQPQP